MKLAVILGCILGGALLIGGGPALRAFTSDPATLAAAAPLLPLVAASQPINALAFVWDGAALSDTTAARTLVPRF